MDRTYLPTDLVVYTGEKHRGDIGGKPGEVCCQVENQPGTYVVAFGSDDFVLSGTLLAPFQGQVRTGEDRTHKKSSSKDNAGSKKDRSGPIVERRRGNVQDDSEED